MTRSPASSTSMTSIHIIAIIVCVCLRFNALSTAAFVVASTLVLGTADALRYTSTSNGFNGIGKWGLACYKKLDRKVLKTIVGNFLGCGSDPLSSNCDKFNNCCKGYNPNYYHRYSVL
ncbi:hypothetical protein BGZ81_009075 [Podila clonocystis]|nr:hypothetical protein BGZ81_009075 [Podila clonocystis]